MTGIPYLDIIIFSAIIYGATVWIVFVMFRQLRKAVTEQQKIEVSCSSNTSQTLQSIKHTLNNQLMINTTLGVQIKDIENQLKDYKNLAFLYEEVLKKLQQMIGSTEKESEVNYKKKFNDWAWTIWENDGTIDEHYKVVQISESVRDRIYLVELIIDIILKQLYKSKV